MTKASADSPRSAGCAAGGRHFAKVAAISFAAAIIAVAAALFIPPRGNVFFTVLDDSAQCSLARGFGRGMPVRFHDDAFAAVPEAARPALLYRPADLRKTRDIAHKVYLDTFVSEPFFQPFLPLQRAFLPGLPAVLALAALVCLALWAARGRPRRAVPPAALVAVALALLTPWPAHFLLSPFAEGVATLFAALGLCLSFLAPPRGGAGCAALGFAEGLCLGLAVTFHQSLPICVAPIAAFSVMRAGRPRHALFLALGAAAGLAPLVWTTKCVATPYGDFLSPAVLRAWLAGDPAVRVFAVMLAAATVAFAALVCSSFSRKIRAATTGRRFGCAVSAACAAATVLAVIAALALPRTHKALMDDRDGVALALPAIVALCAAAFARRRPSSSFVVAAMAVAALPFLNIQGNETFVGIWSLRRSLPMLTLLPLAAFLAAFDGGGFPVRAGAWLRRAAAALAVVCAVIQVCVMPRAYCGGEERGAAALVLGVEERLRPGALYLFARVGDAAPFAAASGREVFGLNDGISNSLGHGAVVDWLRAEARRRPTYVVALDDIPAPIAEDGIVLLPEGEPISGEVARVDGRGFRSAAVSTRTREFAFLRVLDADSPDGAAALRGGALLRPGLALPFGMAPGGWDVPRRGKPGRWACDGASFWGPVPAPGETIEIDFSASWWTGDGTNAPPQTLLVEPPFACDEGAMQLASLPPSPAFQQGRWLVTRSAGDVEDRPSTGLYRIRATERYDERGFPPALAASFESLGFRRQ